MDSWSTSSSRSEPAAGRWLRPDNRAGAPAGGKPDVLERPRSDDGGGRVLACAACHHPITTAADRTEVDGRHEHDAVNPHGYGFHVGCFTRAPGVVPRGPDSDHWSWFPGYRWQITYCRGCARHLGWLFRSHTRAFHGLALDRLVELDDDDA